MIYFSDLFLSGKRWMLDAVCPQGAMWSLEDEGVIAVANWDEMSEAIKTGLWPETVQLMEVENA